MAARGSQRLDRRKTAAEARSAVTARMQARQRAVAEVAAGVSVDLAESAFRQQRGADGVLKMAEELDQSVTDIAAYLDREPKEVRALLRQARGPGAGRRRTHPALLTGAENPVRPKPDHTAAEWASQR